MTARRNFEWSDGAAGPLLRAVDAPVTDWRLRAACTPAVEHLFFPPQAEAETLIAQAKAICGRCPVRAECLDWALRHPGAAEHGVWGGMTVCERRPLSRPEPRVQALVDVTSKRCPSCETTKDADDFNRDKARPDGLDTNCRDCRRARKAEMRAAA